VVAEPRGGARVQTPTPEPRGSGGGYCGLALFTVPEDVLPARSTAHSR
jgi:hypothetical protein